MMARKRKDQQKARRKPEKELVELLELIKQANESDQEETKARDEAED